MDQTSEKHQIHKLENPSGLKTLKIKSTKKRNERNKNPLNISKI